MVWSYSLIIDTSSSPTAFTLESIFTTLLPYASKWQSLGEALSLDEDRLDEIYTNNETDETCLQEMLEVYMMSPNLSHSWKKIQEALIKIGGELTKEIFCKLLCTCLLWQIQWTSPLKTSEIGHLSKSRYTTYSPSHTEKCTNYI